jgi:hypothetical protein
MALGKTWYTLDEATGKYGVPITRISEWVEEGLVRTEIGADSLLRVNVDDLKVEVENYARGEA